MDISGQVDADVGDLQDRLVNVHQPVHQPCLSLWETEIVRQWKHGRERERGRRGKKRKEEGEGIHIAWFLKHLSQKSV